MRVRRNYGAGDLSLLLVSLGLPQPQREYQFHPSRKWRFDYAWPAERVALEVEGGAWVHGRHVRPEGYERDCEKYSEAAIRGWRVIRATTGMIESGLAFSLVERALQGLEEVG